MQVDKQKLVELWATDQTTAEIAAILGITPAQLYSAARRHALPRRTNLVRRLPDKVPDPTPAELAERAKAVRMSWTPEEREKRRVGPQRRRWEIPTFAFNYDGVLVER